MVTDMENDIIKTTKIREHRKNFASSVFKKVQLSKKHSHRKERLLHSLKYRECIY